MNHVPYKIGYLRLKRYTRNEDECLYGHKLVLTSGARCSICYNRYNRQRYLDVEPRVRPKMTDKEFRIKRSKKSRAYRERMKLQAAITSEVLKAVGLDKFVEELMMDYGY